MFRDDKNLKDKTPSLSISLKDSFVSISYSKTDKLITALYMVTDIMDKEEPLRNKLRTLGIEIVSDMHLASSSILTKIYEVVSFLDIASAINLITEMNLNILKKEFLELDRSIKEYLQSRQKSVSLEDLFLEESVDFKFNPRASTSLKGHSIGHQSFKNKEARTRIGVQKGSTLMQALSDRTHTLSDNNHFNFDDLKKQRREDILAIFNNENDGFTIKDIKNIIKDKTIPSLIYSGEKTLQRELISIVKDGVLNKKGEKRWSKYFKLNP